MHVQKESWRQGKCISNLIRFFSFFFNFHFGSGHTIPIILYSTNIFQKKTSLFHHFQHDILFNNSFLFQTCQFFLSIFIQNSKIFFSKALIFFLFFSSFIQSKHHPTLRKNRMRNYLFVFFSEIENTFFCFDKSQIFSNFNDVMKFINTKIGKYFFNFS